MKSKVLIERLGKSSENYKSAIIIDKNQLILNSPPKYDVNKSYELKHEHTECSLSRSAVILYMYILYMIIPMVKVKFCV